MDSCIVSQAEVFAAIEGIALADALGIEGIERFQEDVFSRDVAAADGEALDAVEVAVGDAFRTVAAEEGAVLEVFIVGEGIPAAGPVRIGLADVDAGYPEVRRAATRSAAEVKGRVARFMIFIDRMAIHIAGKVGAILAVVQGDSGLVAASRCKGMIVVSRRAQISSHDAEVR